MVTVTLRDGSVHKFNLKNFEREFAMRTTWYAMSDTPKYALKQIKVTTDRGEDLVLKVGDMVSCTVEDRTYAYDEPVVKPKKERDPSADALEEDMKRFLEPGNPEIANLMKESIECMKDETHKKAFMFLEGLRERNIPVDLNDVRLHMILMETIQDSIENVGLHIEEYIKYREKKGE